MNSLEMNETFHGFSAPLFESQVRFEIVSWIGRHFKKYKSKIYPSDLPILLDLGVGANFKDGWTHVDFFSLRFWKKINKEGLK